MPASKSGAVLALAIFCWPNALPPPKAEPPDGDLPNALLPPNAPPPNALVEVGAVGGLAKGFAVGAGAFPNALVDGAEVPNALVVAAVPNADVAGGVEPKAEVVGGVEPKALTGAEGDAVAEGAGGALPNALCPNAEVAGLPNALCPNADWGGDGCPNPDWPNALPDAGVEVCPNALVAAGVDVCPNALVAGVEAWPKALVGVDDCPKPPAVAV